jgi:hypothetical protein
MGVLIHNVVWNIAVGDASDVVERLAGAGNDPCDWHHHRVAHRDWINAPTTIEN